MDFNNPVVKVIISVVPIVIAITFHEVAHGYMAYRLGDPTAKALGRLSLDPLKHVDPVGTVVLPIMLYLLGMPVFGWAKPVPIGVRNFKNLRRDMALTGAAGPAMNLALALLSVILIRFLLLPLGGVIPEGVYMGFSQLLWTSAIINIWLAAFNLIPVPPFDGSRVLAGLVPRHMANAIDRLEPYGMIILFVMILTGIYRVIVMPLYELFYSIIINPVIGSLIR